MTVDVTVNPDLPLFNLGEFLQQVFYMENLWLEVLIRLDPLSVKINARQRISIVSAQNAIRV